MDWDEIGFVKASHVRERVLRELVDKPLTPRDLTRQLNLHFPQVSVALKQLTQRGLTTCLTESRQKGRLYGITSRGQAVVAKL